jgi:D-glycero-D-manno-heptose 1,7-bisphosphate phosphatase
MPSHVAVQIPELRKGDGHVHLAQDLASQLDETRLSGAGTDGRKPAVFLDRDGVLVEDVGFLRRPSDVTILPGVAQALRSLASRFNLVVITNQSGIARGLFSEDDLLAIHQELAKRLANEGVAIDAYYYCPHLADGPVTVYSVDCECRKPKPGMLLQASWDFGLSLENSYMVGDSPRDVLAGQAAGTNGIILGDNGNGCPGSVTVAENLVDAAEMILARTPVSLDPSFGEEAGPVVSIPAVPEPGRTV